MRRKLRSRVTLAALAVGAALAIAGGAATGSAADPSATAAAPVKVSMGDNFFDPVKAKVKAGGKVRWTNDGKVEHNVTFKGGSWVSGNISPGSNIARKFNKAGKFPYVCTLHTGMNGKIRVVAAK